MGVMMEAAMGTAVARSLSGCAREKPSTAMVKPVFWTPVSTAMEMMSSHGFLKRKDRMRPDNIPSHTLHAADTIICQFITLNR